MEAAYELKPLPDLQYNLAQCYERLGRYDRRGDGLRDLPATATPNARRSPAVEARIANLRERAAGDGGRIAGAAAAVVTEKVVFKTIVVYGRRRRRRDAACAVAAYGLGVLALGALASGDRVRRAGASRRPTS